MSAATEGRDGQQSESPSAASSPSAPPASAPLADSPWFWLLLFSIFGLAALVTVGPKYSLRQGGIETRFQNRETAGAWQGEEIESAEAVDATRLPRAPGERNLRVSLRPLFVWVGALVAVGLIGLSLLQLRRGSVQLPKC